MKYTEAAKRATKHVCVFGTAGSGKSTLASRLALAGFKLQWLSLDGGHTVADKLPDWAQENINLINIRDTSELPVAYNTMSKLVENKATNLCIMHGMVDCTVCKANNLLFEELNLGALTNDNIVIVDHATQLTDSCQSVVTKGKPIDYKLQLDDYGSLRFFLLRIMKAWQAAPYNLVVISQEMESELEDKQKRLMPWIGSSTFAPNSGSYFDHVVHCKVMNKKHKFGSSTTYEANVITKSRSDISIETMSEPSLLPFFAPPGIKSDVECRKFLDELRSKAA